LRALASGADPSVPAASPEQAIDTGLVLRHALEDQTLPPGALDHLRAALDAAAGHREGCVQALLAVHSFENGQREAAAHHAAAALLAPTPEVDRAYVLRCAARVKMRMGEDAIQVLALAEEAVALARKYGQNFELCSTLTTRRVLMMRRDHDLEGDLLRAQELLALWRAHGPSERVCSGMVGVALALGFLHRVPEQLLVLDQARALAAELGQHRLLAFATSITGYALADLRRYAESAACYRQCLQMSWDNASWREWFYALWNLPRTLAHLRRPDPAAQLMGFAEAFYAQRFGRLGVEDLPEARRTQRLVAAQLGKAQGALLWCQGASMSMAEVMRLALAQTGSA
jgi:tetratricopeptide (TPR) repeat protein